MLACPFVCLSVCLFAGLKHITYCWDAYINNVAY